MRGGEVYDVFLNYSRADSAAAEDLRARLMEAGLTAFVDRYALPASQPWQPWLEQHLKFCRALAALVGSEGLGEWQHREIQLGLDRQASAAKAGQAFPVIPVLLPGLASDAIPIGSFLSLNTWVDLRSGLDDPESLQSPISGAQGAAIDAAAAEKLLAGLTPPSAVPRAGRGPVLRPQALRRRAGREDRAAHGDQRRCGRRPVGQRQIVDRLRWPLPRAALPAGRRRRVRMADS